MLVRLLGSTRGQSKPCAMRESSEIARISGLRGLVAWRPAHARVSSEVAELPTCTDYPLFCFLPGSRNSLAHAPPKADEGRTGKKRVCAPYDRRAELGQLDRRNGFLGVRRERGRLVGRGRG